MSDRAYRGIFYDDPAVQAQFEQLVGRVRDAERAREPIAARHRKAEDEADRGAIGDSGFQSVDAEYIAANNAIAAAQRAVDEFLSVHRNYKTRSVTQS